MLNMSPCLQFFLTSIFYNIIKPHSLMSSFLTSIFLYNFYLGQEAADDKVPQSERGIKSHAILGRQVKGIVTEQVVIMLHMFKIAIYFLYFVYCNIIYCKK